MAHNGKRHKERTGQVRRAPVQSAKNPEKMQKTHDLGVVKGRHPKMQISSFGLNGEECFPDVFDGGRGGGCAKAPRWQMAPRVQEAQQTGFLELKECTGVREGATLGDIAGNTG